jgi:peptidoglycan-associated lipoprotein
VPPPPPAAPAPAEKPPTPPEPVPEPTVVPPEPAPAESNLANLSLDEINKNSPFQPVFFALDSYELDGAGQQALSANAAILKKNPGWVITIEGHCDERGTAEYNLALGEKRAIAAKTYLLSLGVPADRLRTVSYGKEFPFDPGHDEGAWSKNRRAHFVVTSK